ncbi:MAG: hypothetical protein ACYSX0_08350 [Planctomycetota bacterium]|jgi:cell shape-determining protein MreC
MRRLLPLILLIAACASADENRREVERLRAEVDRLQRELDQVRFWLDQYRSGPHRMLVTEVTGKVLAVEEEKVQISLGSADGLKVGDVLQLRRGASYVGQVVIVRVEKDSSVGEFDKEFTGSGAPPRSGDIAELMK